MKRLLVAGGMFGFGSGLLLGVLTEGSTWPGVLWRASVAALVLGYLFRWFGQTWTVCLNQVRAERRAAAEKAQSPQAALLTSKQ